MAARDLIICTITRLAGSMKNMKRRPTPAIASFNSSTRATFIFPTVYIYDANENRADVPSLLKAALHDNEADEEHSIDCLYDSSSRKFRVSRVGSKSTIAQLWGMSPVSYPCLTGHSYDQAVSRIYPEVSRTGDPHYDHIYAAMASPVGDVVWVPYQRVVLPLRYGRSKKGVRIVTELAKVDISPL